MQTQSRIPKLNEVTFDSALMWFSEMQCSGLLFHPEDDPDSIFTISDGTKTFNEIEVKELRFLLEEIENGIGHENLIAAVYPIVMNAFGNPLDA